MPLVKRSWIELKLSRINVWLVVIVIMSQIKSVVLMHAEFTGSVGHTRVMTSMECS